jgi:hypothetical protein
MRSNITRFVEFKVYAEFVIQKGDKLGGIEVICFSKSSKTPNQNRDWPHDLGTTDRQLANGASVFSHRRAPNKTPWKEAERLRISSVAGNARFHSQRKSTQRSDTTTSTTKPSSCVPPLHPVSAQDDELFREEENAAIHGFVNILHATDGSANHHRQTPRIDCQSRKTVGSFVVLKGIWVFQFKSRFSFMAIPARIMGLLGRRNGTERTCLLTPRSTFFYYREEHIQKKVDGMIVEAKAKMAKGDKKGNYLRCLCLSNKIRCPCGHLSTFPFLSITSRGSVCNETKKAIRGRSR